MNLKVKRRLDLHESPVWETPEPNSVEVWTSTHPAEADRLQITFLVRVPRFLSQFLTPYRTTFTVAT